MLPRLPVLSALLVPALSACEPEVVETDPGRADLDGDGVVAALDCDDGDAEVAPGLDEVCDGKDNDCDGETDEGAIDVQAVYLDGDGDGYGTPDSVAARCGVPEGFADNALDCDDRDPDIRPGAEERCNQADDDCDGTVDEDPVDGTPFYPDFDRDGYGGEAGRVLACTAPPGHLTVGGDCNDNRAAVNPEGVEVCDRFGIDEDCDGLVNDADPDVAETVPWFEDLDGDGFGDRDRPVFACEAPAGRIAEGRDCRDDLVAVNPDAETVCGNGLDDNCDDHEASCGVAGDMPADEADGTRVAGTALAFGGEAVVGLGDWDGDGLGDLALGAPGHDLDRTFRNAGRAGWFRGPVSGTDDLPDAPRLWEGAERLGVLGETLARVPPLTEGDPVRLAVGEPGRDPGRVWLLGPDDPLSEAPAVLEGLHADRFGEAIAAVGDLDGDGLGELAIGAPDRLRDGSRVGELAVFEAPSGRLTAESADLRIAGRARNDRCGVSVLALDDDGDGTATLVLGCDDASRVGKVVLFDGISSGVVSDEDGVAVRTPSGLLNTHLGTAMAQADLNDDGYADLAVGAPGRGTVVRSANRVWVIHGPFDDTPGLDDAATELVGEAELDRFGEAIAAGGDVNGDGLPDLLVGAPGHDERRGRGYLWTDLPTGTVDAADADARLLGEEPDNEAGRSVDIAPDLDGDGYDDVLLGAPGLNLSVSISGGVWVHRGGVGF
jgi:hypothetical protein